MYYGHMSGIGGIGMILFWILFIGVIIWLISQNKRTETPRDKLKKRLSSGEISTAEYDKLLKKIS